MVDENNWVGFYIAGTGASGRRIAKNVAGVITDLDASQGVSNEWLKVEASGTTIAFYEGGTGATPGTWNEIWSGTVTDHSSETSQGFSGYSSDFDALFQDFEAGALAAGGVPIPVAAHYYQRQRGNN